MRKLKYHEQKLLKKTDFYDWKNVSSIKKAEVTRRYRLSSRNDYGHYEKIVGYVTKMCSLVKKLPPNDPFAKEISQQLLEKLFDTVILLGTHLIEGLV